MYLHFDLSFSLLTTVHIAQCCILISCHKLAFVEARHTDTQTLMSEYGLIFISFDTLCYDHGTSIKTMSYEKPVTNNARTLFLVYACQIYWPSRPIYFFDLAQQRRLSVDTKGLCKYCVCGEINTS